MTDESQKYTPIDSLESIDESNYLIADFRSLLSDKDIEGYEQGIAELWRTGRAIEESVADGFADRIGGQQNYYLEALRWFRGQAATASWIQIPPLDLNSDSNNYRNQLDQFFQNWLPNFLNEFFNKPILTSYYFFDKKTEQKPLGKRHMDLLERRAGELLSDMKKLSDGEQKKIREAHSLEEWQTYFDSLIKNPYEEGNL